MLVARVSCGGWFLASCAKRPKREREVVSRAKVWAYGAVIREDKQEWADRKKK